MKLFQPLEVHEAIEHAIQGEQSLHVHSVVFPDSPKCFRLAIARGEQIAHLFDQDTERLSKTAKDLGVRQVLIEHVGTKRQHVDLCGGPFKKAVEFCKSIEGQAKGLFP